MAMSGEKSPEQRVGHKGRIESIKWSSRYLPEQRASKYWKANRSELIILLCQLVA